MRTPFFLGLLLGTSCLALPACVLMTPAAVTVRVSEALMSSDLGGERAADGTWVQFLRLTTTANRLLSGTRRPNQPWQLQFDGRSLTTAEAIAFVRALGSGSSESRRQEILSLLNEP